ncbi:MAG: hypothetical protein U0234_19400 [Sandaracinus sp.]
MPARSTPRSPALLALGLATSLGATVAACDTPAPAAVDASFPDAPSLPASRFLGRCFEDYQCPGNGAFCRTADDGYPGGLCTLPCTDRTECDDGAVYNLCVTVSGETGSSCAPICRNASDCPSAFTCNPNITLSNGQTVGACVPQCGTDAECGGTSQCDAYTGRCVPQGMVPTAGADNGEACSSDSACRGQNCIEQTASNGYIGGYCISFCRLPTGYNNTSFFTGTELPSGTCGGDHSICIPNGAASAVDDLGICLRECRADTDCRAGFECVRTVGTSTFSNGWCAPVDCLAGGTCPSGTTCHQGTDSNGNPLGRCG